MLRVTFLLLKLLAVAVAVPGPGPVNSTLGERVSGCVRWRRGAEGVRSQLLRRECELPGGRAVCCAAVSNTSTSTPHPHSLPHSFAHSSTPPDDRSMQWCSRGVGLESCDMPAAWNSRAAPASEESWQCTVTREYLPSRYELSHFRKAEELANIADSSERLEALIQFIASPEEVSELYVLSCPAVQLILQ